MSSIPQDFIRQLVNKCDIVALIQSYLPLIKKGSNYVANCPFHEEATPSFTVSSQQQFYYCFGCKASGNAISFIMQYNQLGFVEAVETLAQHCQMPVPRDEQSRTRASHAEGLYGVMERASRFYQMQLMQSRMAQEYLEKRGFSSAIIQKFGLGFAPKGWDHLLKSLTRGQSDAPCSPVLLKTAGLLVQKSADHYYDRFRERIMFPIRDRRGRCIGFGGRVLSPHQEPKYLNSPETPIFHKGNELYGLYEACQTRSSFERIWVVEGYVDVLSLHQFGITQVVATLGTAISRTHLQQLFRLTEEVVFCFDGDTAGRQAAVRALELSLAALQDGWHIRFLLLPQGEDPDSWVRRGASKGESLESLLPQSLALSQFLFQYLQHGINLNSVEGKSKLGKKALPLLRKVPKGIMREQLYAELAHLTNVSRDQLEQLGNASHIKPRTPIVAKKTSYSIEERAMGLLLQYPQQLAPIIHADLDARLSQAYPRLVKLVALIQAIPDSNTAILIEAFRHDATNYDAILALAQYDWLVPAAGVVEEFKGILSHLEKAIRERTIERLLRQAKQTSLTEEQRQQLSDLLRSRHRHDRAE